MRAAHHNQSAERAHTFVEIKRGMRNVALGLIAVTLSGAFALAEDRAPIERAAILHEFSREMLECSVYYRVANQCFEDYPDPRASKVASEYRAAAFTAWDALRYNRTDTALVRVVIPVADNRVDAATRSGIALIRAAFTTVRRFFPN